MQETCDPSLVQEGPTCRRATKPVDHNYWACALTAHDPKRLRPVHPRAGTPQQEKSLEREACAGN